MQRAPWLRSRRFCASGELRAEVGTRRITRRFHGVKKLAAPESTRQPHQRAKPGGTYERGEDN